MPSITIVMYHYVRDKAFSRYPELKALEMSSFISQLDYLQNNYVLIGVDDVMLYLQGYAALPERACLLTFDDGYLDHYLNVFPELHKRGIKGAFYPPCMAIRRNHLMEVNKIQLILACVGYDEIDKIVRELRNIYISYNSYENFLQLEDFDTLYSKYAKPSRFDGADVMFVKAMLQYALPDDFRSSVIQILYDKVMDTDECVLAKEMYMSLDMLKVMAKNGMHIGSHGDSHVWLNRVSPEQQKKEVENSLSMLEKVYGDRAFMWTMCYPFGGNDASLRSLCEAKNCAFALTTVPEIADLHPNTRFSLSRIDTNDISNLSVER